MIMVITDGFTKYTELVAIPNKSAETCSRALFERWICRFGVPAVLVSDRGREFLNDTVNQMTEYLGVTHKFSNLRQQEEQGEAVRSRRSLPSPLPKCQTRTEPEIHLPLEGGVHSGRGRGASERHATPDANLETNTSTCQPGQAPHGKRTTDLAGLEAGRTGTSRTD